MTLDDPLSTVPTHIYKNPESYVSLLNFCRLCTCILYTRILEFPIRSFSLKMRSWHCQPNSLWFQAQWKERDINDQTALRRCSFLSVVEWYHKFLAGDQTRPQLTVVCSAHFLSPSLSRYKPTIMDSSSTSFLPRSCLKNTAHGKKNPVFVMNLPKSDEMDKKNSSNHKTIPRSSLRSSSRPRRRGLGFGFFQGNNDKNNAAVLMINKDPSMRSLSSETLATADSYSSASAGVNRYSEDSEDDDNQSLSGDSLLTTSGHGSNASFYTSLSSSSLMSTNSKKTVHFWFHDTPDDDNSKHHSK